MDPTDRKYHWPFPGPGPDGLSAFCPQPSEDVLARHPCLGDDGTHLTVLEICYVLHQATSSGKRIYPGARRWTLQSGEEVRLIDHQTFEVMSTAELLVRLGN